MKCSAVSPVWGGGGEEASSILTLIVDAVIKCLLTRALSFLESPIAYWHCHTSRIHKDTKSSDNAFHSRRCQSKIILDGVILPSKVIEQKESLDIFIL